MARRDYLLKRIKEFSAVLAKILKLRYAGDFVLAEQQIDHTLREWLKLDPDVFSSLPPDDIALVLRDLGWQEEGLELVAELLLQKGHIRYETSEPEAAHKHWRQASAILQNVNLSSEEYSLERLNKIRDLEERLKFKD